MNTFSDERVDREIVEAAGEGAVRHLMRRLLVVAVAAAEIEVEPRGEVDGRIREACDLLIFRIHLCDAEDRAKDGHRVDGRQGAGFDGDEVLLDEALLVRVIGADQPIEQMRLS